MPFYHRLGQLPKKRHIAFRRESGEIYHEQLMGIYGFSGPASLLYHIHPPTAVKNSRKIKELEYVADDETGMRMRHLKTANLARGGSPTLDRSLLLFNNDVAMYSVAPSKNDEHFYRNGMADEIVFVAEGSGVLETQMGNLTYGVGDQLIIPRSIIHRFKMNNEAHRLIIVESTGYLRTPRRYRTEFGQLKEGAPFSERDFRLPTEINAQDKKGEYPLIVKQYRALHELTMNHYPLDVVGWDGYYFPWAFNIKDFEPIVGAIHQPPPMHQVLESDQFVYCNFCPRPFDFYPDAVPAPYNHANVMSDEVLFYISKEFMSRKGIEYGSITLHPDGLPHGPHPGLYEASIGKPRTEEYALMVDTFRPLKVARGAMGIEDKDYHQSWIEG